LISELRELLMIKTVTAAIIERDGCVLLARRAASEPLGGYWEFPGGKLEPGESESECLARELHEELGVAAAVGTFVAESEYTYDKGTIRLVAYRCDIGDQELVLSAHDRAEWVQPEELTGYDLLPADVPIAEKLATP
jgi:8-oxo-dGTP diphosphatase